MAQVITSEEAAKMKAYRPSETAVADITKAIEGLRKALKRHNCVGFVDMVCGELHVVKKKRGHEFLVLDRDDGEQPGMTQCLGAYLFLPVEAVINAEHDTVWSKKGGANG